LHVAAEEFVSARKAISRCKNYSIPSDDEATRAEWQFFEARVALEDSPLDVLESAVSPIEIVPRTYSVGRRAACLALVLRLRLMQGNGGDVLRPLVADLEAAHMIVREIGAQDFEAHSLFLGLNEIGEYEKARTLLDDYVRCYRRSRRPLARAIQRLKPEEGGSAYQSESAKEVNI
jgi:hypothetical protein